jgi:hypothetical protein
VAERDFQLEMFQLSSPTTTNFLITLSKRARLAKTLYPNGACHLSRLYLSPSQTSEIILRYLFIQEKPQAGLPVSDLQVPSRVACTEDVIGIFYARRFAEM